MFSSLSKMGTSLTFKGVITGFLILFMMIPAMMVQDLVQERKNRQEEVIAEVSSKWADKQLLSGPYLSVPYTHRIVDGNGKIVIMEKTKIILPEVLNVNGNVEPQFKKRGIYRVALYKSKLLLGGHFNLQEVSSATNDSLRWNHARLCIGVSDTRGIEAQPVATFMGNKLNLDAGVPGSLFAANGASVSVDLSGLVTNQNINYQIPLQLRGSESLQVVPVGKSSEVDIVSPWTSPSFTGKFLPEYQLNKDGFKAKWKVLHFNRDFPQIWENQHYEAAAYAFGVSLIQPTDHYAKTTRSVKYAILFIGLTFGFFFLLEAIQGHHVHPVQYVLTGIALVVFYSLLLAFGEIIDFNAAYAIAATATTILITTYGKQLFESWKNALILGGFLGSLYAFIFVLIQLEDRSLLTGSIGLFFLIAIAMHISRKIKWYGNETAEEIETK